MCLTLMTLRYIATMYCKCMFCPTTELKSSYRVVLVKKNVEDLLHSLYKIKVKCPQKFNVAALF